ncbi:hypothetical protein KC19_4G257600 [Ceratodon purpureus]|uniref:Uncharacterized protein n=1 Tax=Ceratodon purpureus TaxID=3225 RepID=A0A8T0IFA3_CERPU|nr:hypothetical protein KC19_4G257600 [Ceratodon purpureus]
MIWTVALELQYALSSPKCSDIAFAHDPVAQVAASVLCPASAVLCVSPGKANYWNSTDRFGASPRRLAHLFICILASSAAKIQAQLYISSSLVYAYPRFCLVDGR